MLGAVFAAPNTIMIAPTMMEVNAIFAFCRAAQIDNTLFMQVSILQLAKFRAIL